MVFRQCATEAVIDNVKTEEKMGKDQIQMRLMCISSESKVLSSFLKQNNLICPDFLKEQLPHDKVLLEKSPYTYAS